MPFRITLSNSSGVPFYKQIINQIIFAKANGQIQAGEQLPTVRQLAVDLQINLNTVAKAYKELEIRNIVSTQQGTGTFISDTPHDISDKEKQEHLKQLCKLFLKDVANRGITPNEAIKTLNELVQTKQPKGEE